MTEKSPLKEAQETFIKALDFRSQPAEQRSLVDALACTLHESVTAPMDTPPYPRSIVEGYLIDSSASKGASEEQPVSFDIVGSVKPGDSECPTPTAGQAIEVATGSLVPAAPYAIARMWEIEKSGNSISIKRPFPPGFFIEEQGCDIKKGSEILTAGSQLDSKAIGDIASLGISNVSVSTPPRVAIFASGDEVIPHTDRFRMGAIFDCNTPMLSAAVKEAGGIPLPQGIKSDDFEAFVSDVKTALVEADMIVIAGGTAVGGRDFVSDLIREVGELLVDGVPMRSGRPLIMGVAQGKPIVCVAGHPPEALRGFEIFGVAAINHLLGKNADLPTDPNEQKSGPQG